MINCLFTPGATLDLLHETLEKTFPYTRATYGRLIDAWWINSHLGDDPNITIHEFGAWHTDLWKVFEAKYHDLTITDSFGWSQRDYAKAVQSPEDWMKEIRSAGHKTGKVDVQAMNYDEVFDVVCSVSVLEHVVDDKLGLANIFRSLKPGGKFIFTTGRFFTGVKTFLSMGER